MELPRRSSPRASRYDYTSEGIYFITICTRNREHFFGEIKNKEMVLNDLGKYCAQEIKNLNERKTVKVHEWIVMPNHVHILLGMDEWLAKYDTHSDALILNSHSDAPSGRPYTNITIQSNTPRKDVLLARPN
ncbi:MAG: transposase [Candidatus Peribacteria bacterium]|jgi:hypothetical protein|nr:transposase [Candidatus Peribacteria bacterium]